MEPQRYSSLESLATKIIDNVQPKHDGGLVKYMMDEEFFPNETDTVGKIFNHVYDKGSYNIVLILGGIWALFLPLCALIILMTVCYRYLRKHSNNKTQKLFDPISKIWPRIQQSCSCLKGRARPYRKNTRRSSRRKSTVIFVIIMICVANSVAFLILTNLANDRLQWTLDDSESKPALKVSINESLGDFQNFFLSAVSEGRNLTKTVVNDFSSALTIIVKNAVGNFTDGLLLDYGVTKLFNTATKSIGDIQNILAAMQFIHSSQIKTFKRLHEFKGFMDTMRTQLRYLDNVCDITQTYDEKKECLRLKDLPPQLVVLIDQSKLNFESSTSLLFLLREMSLNISSVANEITKGRKAIDAMLSTVYESIQKDFNLDVVFGSIDDIWVQADELVNNYTIIPLQSMQDNKTIENYIVTYSSLRKIVIGCCVFYFFIVITFAIAFPVMIRLLSNGKEELNGREEQYVYENSSGTLSSAGSLNRLIRCPETKKLTYNVFKGFVICAAFFIIVPAAIVVLSFFIGGALQTEGCRYMTNKSGIQQLDEAIDDYLSSNWDSLVGSLNISISGIKIDIKRPKHILKAVTETCKNETEGLLNAVEFRNILDTDSLLKSSMFVNMIGSGKVYARKEISKINGASMIPMSLTPFIKEATNLTKMLVDNIQYKTSINELQKPLLRIDNYTKFVFDLKTYISKMYIQYPKNSDLVFLQKIIPYLVQKIREYDELVELLSNVRKNFLLLQQTRTVSSDLLSLLQQFQGVHAIMSNPTRMISVVDPIYDSVMAWTIPEIGLKLKTNLRILERKLLRCDDLYKGYKTSSDGVCKVFLPEFNSVTICFGWCVIWFQILCVMCWYFSRTIEDEQYNSESEC